MIARQLAAAYVDARTTLYSGESGTDAAYDLMQSTFSQAESLGITAAFVAAVNP